MNCTYTDHIRTVEIETLLEFKGHFKEKVSELAMLTKNLEKKEEGIKNIKVFYYTRRCYQKLIQEDLF